MRSLEEEIRSIGTPFAMNVYIVCSVTQNYFTLGGDNETGTDYDIDGDGTDETAPFKNQMMMITGMEAYAPASGASIAHITIDDIDILGGGNSRLSTDTGPASMLWAGRSYDWDGGDWLAGTTLAERQGGPVYCRRRIGIRADAADQIDNSGAWAEVRIYGFYCPRRF